MIAYKTASAMRILSRGASRTIIAQRVVTPTISLRGYATKRYTEQHEWISVSDNVATMGITDYAAKALGDVVYVEVPEVDQEVSQGDQIGAVESVKAASDIYAPVGGKIIEVNSTLTDKPALINKSPEEDGWLCKIELSSEDEVSKLLDQAAYDKHTQE